LLRALKNQNVAAVEKQSNTTFQLDLLSGARNSAALWDIFSTFSN